MDEERYIYPEEKRCNYFWGGENIYPMQIENFYRKLPNICDVAILGIPNSRMGKIVAAVIEFDDNCSYTKKELLEYSLELPAYQRPCKFIFNKITRNSLGKIDKKEMKRRYFYILTNL